MCVVDVLHMLFAHKVLFLRFQKVVCTPEHGVLDGWLGFVDGVSLFLSNLKLM